MKLLYLFFVVVIFCSCQFRVYPSAFNQGYEAWVLYVNTGEKTTNPYPINSTAWINWQQGWHTLYNGVSNVESNIKIK